MSKRIKLLIAPSGLDDGITFRVYRSATAPVLKDEVLMKVDERVVEKRPLQKDGEVLVQMEDSPLHFQVERFFMEMPTPQVYIDGAPVPQQDVLLYPKERKIKINNQQIEPFTARIITMDYSYLNAVVVDDPTRIQDGVEHYGTEVVHGLNAPSDLNYIFNSAINELKLTIVRDRTPHTFWYAVQAFDELSQKEMDALAEQQIGLIPDDFDVKYELEVSLDEKATWEGLGEFLNNEVLLHNTDYITNKGHSPLDVVGIRNTGTQATITLENPWYDWESNTRPTHWFRVRAVDGEGQVTEWKEFDRGGVNYKPTYLKMRRKEYNGTSATFDGFDAIDLWELTEATVDITQPQLVFTDDHLVDGRTYTYTFYIDDEKGFRSEPFDENVNIL
jgi:hypothetical protein